MRTNSYISLGILGAAFVAGFYIGKLKTENRLLQDLEKAKTKLFKEVDEYYALVRYRNEKKDVKEDINE